MRNDSIKFWLINLLVVAGCSVAASDASAAIPTFATEATVVYVLCDDRQGSGALLYGGDYVLTSGHVVIDPVTHEEAESCFIGFSGGTSGVIQTYYRGTPVEKVLDQRLDMDFAILELGERFAGPSVKIPDGLKVSESLAAGSFVYFMGYPGGETDGVSSSYGVVMDFRRGAVQTNAQIREGYSGGPVVNEAGEVVGVATRYIVNTADGTGDENIESYDGIDILAIENWLDSRSVGHDQYLTHVDYDFAHGLTPVVRSERLPCSYLVRTVDSSTVYCLLPNSRRLSFPDAAVFASWYDDFSEVAYISNSDLAEYKLVASMTYRAGTLIKITTDPKVYFVADSLGTIRHVSSEAAAARLFGASWARMVHDVPDTFFMDYRVGERLE